MTKARQKERAKKRKAAEALARDMQWLKDWIEEKECFLLETYGPEPAGGYAGWQNHTADLVLIDEIEFEKAQTYAQKHEELMAEYRVKLFGDLPEDEYDDEHYEKLCNEIDKLLPHPWDELPPL